MEINYCLGCLEQMAEGEVICPRCGHDNRRVYNDIGLLREGTVLNGKYLVGRVLGRGGFGITYLGLELNLKIKVAIKEFFPGSICSRQSNSKTVVVSNLASNSEGFQKGKESFQKEAETLAVFSTPSIAHVREYFLENNTAYIVMDYIDGIEFGEEVRRCGGRIPWKRVVDLMLPLMQDLDRMHHEHVIHRDIKPQNIRIVREKYTGKEHLVLLDFGAARSYTSSNVTKTYTQILTPGYAPFEQYQARTHLGPYTDIYSLCATMYAGITGEKPPVAPDRILSDEDLAPFSAYGLDVPENVEKAIFHGLEVDYHDRPQTMGELYREFTGESPDGQVLFEETSAAPPESEPVSFGDSFVTGNSLPRNSGNDSALLRSRHVDFSPLREPNSVPSETKTWEPETPDKNVDTDGKKTGKLILILLAAMLGIAACYFFLAHPKIDKANLSKTQPLPFMETMEGLALQETEDTLRTATAVVQTETNAAALTQEVVFSAQTEAAKPTIIVITSTPVPTYTPYPTYTPFFIYLEESDPEDVESFTGETELREPEATEGPTTTPRPTLAPETETPEADEVRENYTDERSGAEMIYIPAGNFILGSNPEQDANAYIDDETPQLRVYLDGYWIGKTEVTNAQYLRCVEAGVCERGYYMSLYVPGEEDYPVTYVTHDQAERFCSWIGGHLPSEYQWEKAARGTDGRIYPWGDEEPDYENGLANIPNYYSYNDADDELYPVGSFPKGQSPYGVMDMTGNVWEWTSTWYSTNYYATLEAEAELSESVISNPVGPENGSSYVVRGGSSAPTEINNYTDFMRSASRGYMSQASSYYVGFRCMVPIDANKPEPASTVPTETMRPTWALKPTAVPTKTNTPKPTSAPKSAETPNTIVPGGTLKVGDSFTFGSYEQDKTRGADPIEWQVLEVEDGHALVISRYGLEAKAYNAKSEDVTWETCTLRQWLNEDFYKKAFTPEENAKIIEVTINNSDNAEYGTGGGENTWDRIFLLSAEEAYKYFTNDEARMCTASYQAKLKGTKIYDDGNSWWWLRSPGFDSSVAVTVSSYGYINDFGISVNDASCAVRPAFWFDL